MVLRRWFGHRKGDGKGVTIHVNVMARKDNAMRAMRIQLKL
jgi:hypothetical protein